MIRELELLGFKSFKSNILEIKPFTLLTGLNSSGKSSVIQALLMAGKAADGNNFLLDDHGTIKELTNTYEKSFCIGISDKNQHGMKLYGHDDVSNVDYGPQRMVMPSIYYSEAGRHGSKSSIKVFNNSSEMDSKGGNLLKCIDTFADAEIRRELWHPDTQGATLLFNLKAWLNIISPSVDFKYSLQRFSDQSFSYFDDHRATNVGFGLSYTLPVIALLLRASLDQNSLVLLENPEAHLHPKGQTEMGKFIATCADCGVNVVVETHSDHLFDGIRLYTKKNPEFAKKFISYWFELDKEKNTKIENVLIDSDGRISNYAPKGFFDQFELNALELL